MTVEGRGLLGANREEIRLGQLGKAMVVLLSNLICMVWSMIRSAF